MAKSQLTELSESPGQYRVFFSHGGEDTYVVSQFLRPKVEDAGAHVFVDAGEIKYGDDFRRIVLDELARCDEFLVLLTRSSIRRVWVFAELGASLMRGVRIVVVKYGIPEEELRAEGVLSLLGSNSLLAVDDFDRYVAQLKDRVEKKRNG